MNSFSYNNNNQCDNNILSSDSSENIIQNNDYLSENSDDNIDDINENNSTNNIDKIRKFVDFLHNNENQLSELNKKRKILTAQNKEIKNQLTILMKHLEFDHININPDKGGGKLKCIRKKTYASISKKTLSNLIPVFCKQYNIDIDHELLITFLYNNREYKEKDNIVKTKK